MGVPRESPEQIFISYAREDSAFATQINRDLQAAGFVTWMDRRNIPAGSHWDETVQAALDHCTRMVVVLSPASVSSENVLDEVSYARNKKHRVIPLLAAQCDVPFRLQRLHWIDFTAEHEQALATLCARLAEPMDASSTSVADSLRPTERRKAPPTKWIAVAARLRQRLPLTIAVVLTLVGAGAGVSLYRSSLKRPHIRAVAGVSPRAASIGVFWVAPNGAIGQRYWDAKGGAWGAIPPSITLRSVAAADSTVTVVKRTEDELHAFWVGPDHSIRTDYWVRQANWHYNFTVLGTAADGTGVTALARDSDQVACFWVGREHAIWTRSWSASSQQWGEARRITDPAVVADGSSISAVARMPYPWGPLPGSKVVSSKPAPQRIEVFWVGPDGSVRQRRWTKERDWHGLDDVDPAPSGAATGATITAISRKQDQLDLFWIAADGSVKAQWWCDKAPKGQQPSWDHPIESITDPGAASPGAQVAAVATSEQRLDLFWVDEDGAIATKWWASNWDPHKPPSALLPAGTALRGSSVTAVLRTPNNLDLFWIDNDRALQTMALEATAGESWSKSKPAALTPPDAL